MKYFILIRHRGIFLAFQLNSVLGLKTCSVLRKMYTYLGILAFLEVQV